MLRVTRQVGFDPDGNGVAEPGPALELEAPLLADQRTGTIATDDITGARLEFGAVEPLANPGNGLVRSMTDRHHLVIEADVGAKGTGGVEQDRLKNVLRGVAHLTRAGRGVVGATVVAGAPRHHATNLASGKRRRKDLFAHQMPGQRASHDATFDPKVAEDLHGALIGDMCAGRIGRRAVLGDGQ